MNKKLKYSMLCGALFLGCFTGSTLSASDVAANSEKVNIHTYAVTSFKDVSPNHYAYDAVNWAKAKGIVAGYTTNGKPNGLFGPDDPVTEAQFVKMVAQYLGLKDDGGDIRKAIDNGAHWSDSVYDAIAKYEVPLRGYLANDERDTPMLRGSVAQALGYLIGNQEETIDSIHFLIENGITNGQYPQYEKLDLHEFFGSYNELTRAQVVTFLYRMDNHGLNDLSHIAKTASKNSVELMYKAYDTHFKADRTFDVLKFTGLQTKSKESTENELTLPVDYSVTTLIYMVEGINTTYGGTLIIE